jgi:lambda repressor-like predicted transcriptional regulator
VDTLAFFANIGSLVGLAATLWAFLRTWRFRRRYAIVVRVPDQAETLRRRATRLLEVNNAADRNPADVASALKEVRVALESIARNLGSSHRADFDALERRIRQIETARAFGDVEALDEVWAESKALASKADAIVDDQKLLKGP